MANKKTVQLNKTVTIVHDDEKRTFTLVRKDEVDPSSNKISADSPVGKALIDHHIQDTVEIKTMGGSFQYKIIDIH